MVMIGLDMGTVRVGVAKSDELGMFAHALEYIDRGETIDDLISGVQKLVEQYTPGRIIVGLPKKMDGTAGLAEEKIRSEVDAMQTAIDVPFVLWDERLTTREASRYMAGSGLSGKKKRKKIDGLAAEIMLQSYLDCNKGSF